jgi:hypothetical protein
MLALLRVAIAETGVGMLASRAALGRRLLTGRHVLPRRHSSVPAALLELRDEPV